MAIAGAGTGSERRRQPARADPTPPEPTPARCPSLLVQIPFAVPALPFFLGGGISSTRIEPCLYPSLGLFIHPRRKVKNPITYTR